MLLVSIVVAGIAVPVAAVVQINIGAGGYARCRCVLRGAALNVTAE